MEAMIDISKFMNSVPGLWSAILLTFLSYVIYTFIKVRGSDRVKKFSDINFATWWRENQINFVFNFIATIGIFYASYSSGTLTNERCVMLATVGQYVVDNIMKALYRT